MSSECKILELVYGKRLDIYCMDPKKRELLSLCNNYDGCTRVLERICGENRESRRKREA